MDVRAKMTSQGRVTIPSTVRDALDLHEGDELLFRVRGSRAVVAKTSDFISRAGSVAGPLSKRETPWDDILRETRRRPNYVVAETEADPRATIAAVDEAERALPPAAE